MKIKRTEAGAYYVEHAGRHYRIIRRGSPGTPWDVYRLEGVHENESGTAWSRQTKLSDYRTKQLCIEALAQGIIA